MLKTPVDNLKKQSEELSADTTLPSESYVEQALPRILSTRDLVCLFVIVLFFVTNVGNAVAGGPAGLSLWVIGGIVFFIPCAIASAQLGVLFPYEGSLYSWTHRAFGGFMGFFVGFAAWVPGSLLILATAELVVNLLQGLNAQWLTAPWSQGVVLLVIIVFSCIVAILRHRTTQNMVNIIVLLILLATALVSVSGLVWLLHKQPSATDFSQAASWNPFTMADLPLFGVITLGYLGVNLPLTLGGELAAPHGRARRRVITGHLLWGSLIVSGCYLLSTAGVLIVEGQSASFVLSAPISTVKMALGPIAADITAICIIATLIMATVVYNYVFARWMMVGGIDQRIPIRWGRLNRNRIPANAIVLQTCVACALAVLFFMVIPYVGVFPGPPAHLAASSYFILVGTATILWAFATTFLFVDLLVLLSRRKQVLRSHQLFPTWFLLVSSMVGLLAGLGAIVDTLLNSYDPPDIGNTTWSLLVTGLTVLILLVGFIGAIVASSEASWQGMETLE